ncbi:MAG: DUF2283 domain-containing protein [Snowella sp.]|nr:DUF2283 domain-containing protein [Snowella sp.]
MKIQYFPETDTLAIELTRNPVVSTDAVSDDLILDYDEQGKVVVITLDTAFCLIKPYRQKAKILTQQAL